MKYQVKGNPDVDGLKVAKKDEHNDNLFCSFCGKNQKEVKKLIAGPAVYICDECIQLCSEIIEEENEKEAGDFENLEPLGANEGRVQNIETVGGKDGKYTV